MTTQAATSGSFDQAAPLEAFPACSTYWLPLDEPRQTWASFGAESQLAPTLKATAHAFFALCSEVKALRHFALAVEQEWRGLLAAHAGYWYGQAEHALFEATHHWSRAAYELDALTASGFPGRQDGLQELRAMSRAARAQQERLWKLTDEVRDALVGWRGWQEARVAATKHASQQAESRGGRS